MAKASRTKGVRGEREVAALFRAHGFDCDRVPNSGGLRIKGDLYGSVPVHVEVKRAERLKLPEWVRQAEAESGDRVAVVAYRQNQGAWYGVIRLDDLAGFLASSPPCESQYG